MSFFDRLEELRKKQGIGQGKLEKELGISNGSINKWKISMPKADTLEKVADYYNVTTDYLLEKENKVTCKKCGISYDPLDDFDCAIHERYHEIVLKAQRDYKILLPYSDIYKVSADNLSKVKNNDKDFFDCLSLYLKAVFSQYIYLNYDENLHVDYREFCKSNIVGMINGGDIPQDKVDVLINNFNLDTNYIDRDSAMLARISDNYRIMDILKSLEKLDDNTLDMVSAQIKAICNQKGISD